MLSRDLTVATLYDLIRGLGIGLRGPVGGIPGIEGEAIARLDEMLGRADTAQREILGASLAALMREGAEEGPASPATLAQPVAARRIEQRR